MQPNLVIVKMDFYLAGFPPARRAACPEFIEGRE
jgi:hypothetical protein